MTTSPDNVVADNLQPDSRARNESRNAARNGARSAARSRTRNETGSGGLEFRKLHYSYEGLKVLSEISFSVPPGSAVAVLGPSGCGKSTLLHIAAGLLVPESGDLLYGGESRVARPGWISYMQQDDLLLPWKTVLDNVALPLILKGERDARRRARSELANFGLQGFENHYPQQLSGGMRQRAALMRSCLFRHDFLLLDEPFSRLDFLTRNQIYDWFQQYLAVHNPGFVLVTHDPEEALLLADEIIVLSSRPARIIDRFSLSEAHPRSRNFLARKASVLETMIAKAAGFQ